MWWKWILIADLICHWHQAHPSTHQHCFQLDILRWAISKFCFKFLRIWNMWAINVTPVCLFQITVTDEPDTLFQKVSLLVKGHDKAVLDSYQFFVTMAANELNVKISNVWVRLPDLTVLRWPRLISLTVFYVILWSARYEPKRDIDRFTLLKSVHIFKSHRVQYEMRTHYRCIEVRIQKFGLGSLKIEVALKTSDT